MTRWWALVLLTSCAQAGAPSNNEELPPDARPTVDAPPTMCTQKPFYMDGDGDQHGDPSKVVMACSAPAGTVAAGDDCDDADNKRHPGAPELCDTIDNDCSAATGDSCPAGCSTARRPAPDDAKLYLMCGNATTWSNARTVCASAGFKLVEIESAAENFWIRSTANSTLGFLDLYIGGSDTASEGSWVWDGGTMFWQLGAPVGGRFNAWASGEPNDDGTEDCAEMKTSGEWNDDGCSNGQRFVCRN